MSEELKPCPFCGARIQSYTINDHYEDFVYCDNCGAQGPNDVNKAEATRMWNMRRPEDALTAELSEAREMLTEQEGLARAAEERIEALEETTRWIPVTENLPDVSEMVIYENFQHSRPVLAKDDTGHYWVAYYCNSSGRLYWDCDGPDSIGIVAYWKPIE
jgi:Lar family restriction alleviation protein